MGNITLTEIVAPVTPASNKVEIYVDSTSNNLTVKKDSGSTVDLEAAGSVAGSDTQVQYNDSGSFGASAGLVWQLATGILGVTSIIDVATGYRVANAAASGNFLRGNGTNFVSSAIQAGDFNVVDDTTPQLGGQLDVNGNPIGDGTRELITFTEDGSAVNQLNVENQATGGGPILAAAGDDTNIDLNLDSKGTGIVKTNAVLDVTTGYRIGGAAASAEYLRGNGTNFINSALVAGDVNTAGAVMETDYLAKASILVASAASTPVSLVVSTTDDHVLAVDTSETTGVTWKAAPAGSPAGSDTQLQYNDSAAFGASAGLVWQLATGILGVTSIIDVATGYRVANAAASGNFLRGNGTNFVSSAIQAGDWNLVDDTTPQLGGQLDVNGNPIGDGTRELITFTEDGSAVNQINIENQATGSGPILAAAGDDTNIDLNLDSKGTGIVKTNAVLDATTGYRIGGAAASAEYLRGNGTNFVSSALVAGDVNTAGAVMETDYLAKASLLVASAASTPVSLVVAGTDDFVLAVDTSETTGLTWKAAPAGSPAGSDTQLQYNDSAAFGASAGLVWQLATGILGVTSIIDVATGYRVANAAASGNYLRGNGTNFVSSTIQAGDFNVVDDTTPQLGGHLDVNGNPIGDGTLELITFTETGSAVNQIGVSNAATGTGPTIQAGGGDTNIDLLLVAKGTGVVQADGVEIVTLSASQTLTSKTLTSPTIADVANIGSGSPDAQKVLKGDDAWEDLQSEHGITVEDPTSSEDLTIFFTNRAITVTEMRAVLVGSATPSVTWTIRHGTDRNATGAEVVTSGTATTSTTTGSDVTSLNDATIVADSFVWLETTAQSGTVTEIHISIVYTED